ncbi:MAG: outer membrane receptor for ferrienterochelin and colicins, partial [Patiriisocius sp.]
MKHIITLILCLMSIQGFAQNGTISGKLISKEGSALPFVKVTLLEVRAGAVSGEDGTYKIKDLAPGSYTLTVNYPGYLLFKQEVQLQSGQDTLFDILLEEDAQLLEHIVVSGTMKPTLKLNSTVPVEVYTAEFFKANPTPSIYEALSNVNGVRPQVNCAVCNTGDIHINGLEGPYTMILIDGMPIVSG